MMQDTYRTILNPTSSLFREKGSKFYGFAHHAASEEDMKMILQACKKQYFDATHHCYAYIIGDQSQFTRANDDGEPNHSAGDPILGQIKSFGLTYVLVIVVRYYGGTKLGVGGLKTAYKNAAQEALAMATIIEKKITLPVEITFPYTATNEVMRQINALEIVVEHQTFEMVCNIVGQIPVRNKIQLLKNLELSEHIKVNFL